MSEAPCAIVLGGAGDLGEGLVRQLRFAGWTTVVPSRNEQRLKHTEIATVGSGQLIPIVGDIGDDADSRRIAKEILAQNFSPSLVVAAIGGWWAGPPLLNMEVADWQHALFSGISAHFHAARAFMPLLLDKPGSQYVFINGGAARNPVAGSAPISVAAAAQEMLQRALASENSASSTNIYTLLLNSLILTRARKSAPPGSLTADEVGSAVLDRFDNQPTHGTTVDVPH